MCSHLRGRGQEQEAWGTVKSQRTGIGWLDSNSEVHSLQPGARPFATSGDFPLHYGRAPGEGSQKSSLWGHLPVSILALRLPSSISAASERGLEPPLCWNRGYWGTGPDWCWGLRVWTWHQLCGGM